MRKMESPQIYHLSTDRFKIFYRQKNTNISDTTILPLLRLAKSLAPLGCSLVWRLRTLLRHSEGAGAFLLL